MDIKKVQIVIDTTGFNQHAELRAAVDKVLGKTGVEIRVGTIQLDAEERLYDQIVLSDNLSVVSMARALGALVRYDQSLRTLNQGQLEWLLEMAFGAG